MRPIIVFAVLCALGTAASAAVRPLGIKVPEATSTVAYDINAYGQVAADLEDGHGVQRGVMFHRGVLSELGTLGGQFSNTKAINDNGEIVGSAQNKAGHWRAFVWSLAGNMRDLGTLGGPSSYGQAINSQGEAAGFADTADGQFHAFRYANGTMTGLGTLGGKNSYASGMNNLGQVVGTAENGQRLRHAFVWDAQHGMRDLGTLGGRQSSATAINDAGVIVGTSETADRKWHAFIIENGTMVDLGAKIGFGNSFAKSINKAGHVAGTIASGPERYSFVWRDGQMLVHRGAYSLYVTNAINDADQVIGASKGQRLEAATMSATARPVVAAHGLEELGAILFTLILVTAGLVVHHRRYQGLDARTFSY
jgi:probable HAF family extracellular repeat protein